MNTETMEGARAFADRLKVTASCEWIAERPDRKDDDPKEREWARGATHYRVTLKRPGHRITVLWSQGSGIKVKPDAATVLDSLSLDASYAGDTFEDFCGDMGLDTDSRKALRLYRACRRIGAKLGTFLGQQEYANLMTSVERL